MREAAPLAPKPSAAGRRRGACPGDGLRGRGSRARSRSSTAMCRAKTSDLDRLPAGVEIVPLAEALASGHPLLAQMSPVAAARRQRRLSAQRRLHDRRRGDPRRSGRGRRDADPPALRARRAGSRRDRDSRARRRGGGGVRYAAGVHEGPDGVAYQPNGVVEFVVGDRAAVRHVRLNAEGRDALALSTLTARLGAHVVVRHPQRRRRRGGSRHQIYPRLCGRAFDRPHQRRRHAERPPARRHHAPRRSCRAARRRRELFKTVSTTKRPACSRARSSSGRMRRRRTAA